MDLDLRERERPRQRKPLGWSTYVVVCAALLLSAAAFLEGRKALDGQPQEAPRPPRRIVVFRTLDDGELAVIGTEKGKPVLLPVNDAAWDAIGDAIAANDAEGIQELTNTGRAFFVEPATECRVLKSSGTAYFVRVLDGEHKNRTGWVPNVSILGRGYRGPRPSPGPIPEPARVPIPATSDRPLPPTQATAETSAFRPGQTVEFTGLDGQGGVLCASEEIFEARKRGEHAGKTGTDVFGTEVGTLLAVLVAKSDRLQVRLPKESNWPNREGWIRVESVRALPSTEQLEQTDSRGLSLAKRRQIYIAICSIHENAGAAAESKFPLKNMPSDPAEIRSHTANHKREYDAQVRQGRVELVKQFGVDGKQLDAIEKEGTDQRWPME
jgi:hypothetical protein